MMNQYYSKRSDSGISFTSNPYTTCAIDSAHAIASSASSSSSSSNYPFYDDSAPSSPSSSVLSSPLLIPLKDNHHLPALSLDTPLSDTPTSIELSTYAASIIRNEAYALLALASRIDPIITSTTLSSSSSSSFSPRSSRSGSSSSSLSALDFDQLKISEPVAAVDRVEQSRSNVAFRECIRILSTLPPHGKIIVTGVGKSGIVGRKMVATFCSLGTQAVFLHPLEALHGDLGVICPCSNSHASPSTSNNACDALLLISHSGSTAELMRLLPIVRSRVRATIAITRDPDSILARGCSSWLDAGTGRVIPPPASPSATSSGTEEHLTDEADCVLPAPTSSVVTALAIGDALALSLSRLRIGWSKGGKERRMDFLRSHPGGPLGIALGREVRGVGAPSSTSTSS